MCFLFFFFFSSRRRHTRCLSDWSSDVCSSDLNLPEVADRSALAGVLTRYGITALNELCHPAVIAINRLAVAEAGGASELGHILDRGGREPNRLALIGFFARVQKAGLLGSGDLDRMSG